MSKAGNATPDERVSLVLLSYNHARTVGEALRTALDQSTPAAEIIVSDDHSTDGSMELLARLADENPRMRLVQPPGNLGMAGNANFAVGLAARPFVGLLHHDDTHRRDLVERWADVMGRHDDVAFVFNQYDETVAPLREAFTERMDGVTFLRDRLLRTWGCPVRGTALVRRSHFEAVGGFDERFGLLADVDLWMRLAARYAVGYVAAPLIRVRHDRPMAYPGEYTGLSWRRNRTLYEIHDINTAAAYVGAPGAALRRLRLRAAVSVDAAKWLGYAAVRQPGLLAEAGEGASSLEVAPVRLARRLAAAWAARHAGEPA